MGTSDVLKVFKIAKAIGKSNLRTFKTLRKQVHTIFSFIIHSTKSLHRFVSIATSVLHSITTFCTLVNKLMSVFHVSVLLLIMNFVITLS